jgi:CBS domain-containing protein
MVHGMHTQTPVTAFMTTDVLCLTPGESIESAISRLRECGISGAPVVDDDGRLVGLLDDSDIILSEARVHAPSAIEILGAYFPLPGARHRFEEEVRHALAGTVADVMEIRPSTLGTDSTLTDVASTMVEQHVSRVPIVDDDHRVVGIVSRGDLVNTIGGT